jgi:hypothetical protein
MKESIFWSRSIVLAEELVVIDGDSQLWHTARPLLNAALRLEQNDDTYSWHGWGKEQIHIFLKNLPPLSSLVLGVWETVPGVEDESEQTREELRLGIVCEVVESEVRSIRTFEALTAAGLKPINELEPGIDDALEIMRVARTQIAPIAWALFIEKAAWDEWLFAEGRDGAVIDKGDVLASLARQGRCVILGSQVAHHH